MARIDRIVLPSEEDKHCRLTVEEPLYHDDSGELYSAVMLSGEMTANEPVPANTDFLQATGVVLLTIGELARLHDFLGKHLAAARERECERIRSRVRPVERAPQTLRLDRARDNWNLAKRLAGLLEGREPRILEAVADSHPWVGNGRPPVPTWVKAYCASVYAQSGLSTREAWHLWADAARRGLIPVAPAFNIASRFLRAPEAAVFFNAAIRHLEVSEGERSAAEGERGP